MRQPFVPRVAWRGWYIRTAKCSLPTCDLVGRCGQRVAGSKTILEAGEACGFGEPQSVAVDNLPLWR